MNATLQRHKHNGHAKKAYQYLGKARPIMRPLKKMNKNIAKYVHKKPYQSLGIATLLVGAVAGFIYARFIK